MNIIARLLIILGLKQSPSVETITKPIGAIVRKLADFDREQNALAESHDQAIERLTEEAKHRRDAAAEARVLANRYSALTSVIPAE